MSMDKSEIIKMVLELYSARKEAKEYLDFYAEPNEGQKLEEYKHIIREEFYPSRNREPKTRFSVCRKALSVLFSGMGRSVRMQWDSPCACCCPAAFSVRGTSRIRCSP